MGGDKISTIILKVDLDCSKCYKKICKTICKLQERESIKTVNFDEKNNTVTISGAFDPKKLCKKLCCKACQVIKDIQIKENPTDDAIKAAKAAAEAKEAAAEAKEAAKAAAASAAKAASSDAAASTAAAAASSSSSAAAASAASAASSSDAAAAASAASAASSSDAAAASAAAARWCTCGCRPWYGRYYGDYKCPWCGRGYGWPQECPPPVIYAAPPPYPCGGYKTCTYICDDPQPSCSIM